MAAFPYVGLFAAPVRVRTMCESGLVAGFQSAPLSLVKTSKRIIRYARSRRAFS